MGIAKRIIYHTISKIIFSCSTITFTKQEILRPKINNIESIENDTLYQHIKNNPTTNAAIQYLTELLLRQEKQIQELKEEHSLFINFQTKK